MKKLTRELLIDDAERLMKAHGVKEVFATQDGNFFLKKHQAFSHNRELNTDPQDKWEVIPFAAQESAESFIAKAVKEAVSKTKVVKDETGKPGKGKPAPEVKPKAQEPATGTEGAEGDPNGDPAANEQNKEQKPGQEPGDKQ